MLLTNGEMMGLVVLVGMTVAVTMMARVTRGALMGMMVLVTVSWCHHSSCA